jgi:hypothetical protein
MKARSLLAVAAALVALAAPAASADPAHDPILNCAFHRTNGVLVFAGEAHAPLGHAPLVSLSLTCRYLSGNDTFEATATSATAVVATFGSGLSGVAPITVCESGEARYADGHVATIAETCGEPNGPDVGPLPDPGPPPEVTPGAECVFHRQSGVWVLVAAGHAGAQDVAVSTTVSCRLTDGNAEEVVAQASAIGPTVVATGARALFVAPVASKCVDLTVEYLSSTVQVETCETFE